MRIITGQEFVSSGTVRVDGQNPLENDAVLGRMMFVKESQVYPGHQGQARLGGRLLVLPELGCRTGRSADEGLRPPGEPGA